MTDEKKSYRAIGVELSRSTINVVVIEPDAVVVDSVRVNIDREADLVAQAVEVVGSVLKTHSAPKVGLAVPGLVDARSGRIAYSAALGSLEGTDCVAELRTRTGTDIEIENDANAAAYAEFVAGAGRGSRSMFYATLGEGVGGAFILNGAVWRGNGGFAGEFGYVPINSEGMRLEEVASADNILRRTRERFHQDSTSSLNLLDEEAITLDEIIMAAEADDDFAQLMLKRTGTYVGTAVASVINLLNIERIVVGGEIMGAKHIVLQAIIERARELSFRPSFESTTIVEGSLGDDAAAIGAALISSGPVNIT